MQCRYLSYLSVWPMDWSSKTFSGGRLMDHLASHCVNSHDTLRMRLLIRAWRKTLCTLTPGERWFKGWPKGPTWGKRSSLNGSMEQRKERDFNIKTSRLAEGDIRLKKIPSIRPSSGDPPPSLKRLTRGCLPPVKVAGWGVQLHFNLALLSA